MTHVLIVLALPEETRNRYRERLLEWFPDITVEAVGNVRDATTVADADVLMTFGLMVTDDLFERAGRLKWIQALGTGMDGIIDRPTLRPEVVITNAHGIHGAPVSEAAIAHMLALSRMLPTFMRQQARHEWRRWPVGLLHGKTAGILGVGAIAEALAPRLKALGMRTVGITGTPRDLPGFDEMRPRRPLAAAVGDLDFFVLLIPLDRESRGIVDADVFSTMKPSAYLVNLARGGVVDEVALLAALRSGAIAGAALDVFATEPLPPESPLWDEEGILLTPHNAGYCDVYADMALEIIRPNMQAFREGRVADMINLVRRGA